MRSMLMMFERSSSTTLGAAVAALAGALAHDATAQMAFHTPTAAQPSKGAVLVRPLLHYTRLEGDPDGVDRTSEELTLTAEIDYGLTQDIALMLNLPIGYREESSDDDATGEDSSSTSFGLGEAHIMARWRLYREDTGPVDTTRISLLTGLEVPTGGDAFTHDTVSPMLGIAYMTIRGRHGFNAAARWMITTGESKDYDSAGESTADVFYYDLAYLYRAAPASYGLNDDGAHYLVAELNGTYETNGEHELFLSPGYMYEGRRWAFEVSVQIPVWREIDQRLETKIAVGVGVRFLF